MQNFLLGLLVGAAITFIIYHFNLQPKLRAERDQALAALKTKPGV